MNEENEVEIYEHVLSAEEIAVNEAIEAGAHSRAVEAVKSARHAAYTAPDGSDALYMKYSRQEDGVTKQAWLDRVAAINEAYPYPEPPGE